MFKKNFQILNNNEIKEITDKILFIESNSSAEIKIIILKRKSFWDRKKTAFDIAVKEFKKNKLYKTKDRTGILLLIILKEKEIALIGDSGIHSKVSKEFWDKIVNNVIEKFRVNNFKDGILLALDELATPLFTYFPIKPDDTNEISNDLIIK